MNSCAVFFSFPSKRLRGVKGGQDGSIMVKQGKDVPRKMNFPRWAGGWVVGSFENKANTSGLVTLGLGLSSQKKEKISNIGPNMNKKYVCKIPGNK